jgi:predicted outer membrane lipoprotein
MFADNRTALPRRGAFGFVAGALAVLLFHQVMVLALASAGIIPTTPYSLRPVPPFDVPTILNSMFWGGLWGMLFALIAHRLPIRPLWLKGLVFGLLGPLLVNWFVVSPLKGQPLAAGFVPQRMLAGVLIAGAFGIGLALLYALMERQFGRPRLFSR